MSIINRRSTPIFLDKDDPTPAKREFTFSEASVIGMYLEVLTQRGLQKGHTFSIREALDLLQELYPDINMLKYVRPMFSLVQKVVTAGLYAEVHLPVLSGTTALEDRRFQATYSLTLKEATANVIAKALGIPYVAYAFGVVTVRVHNFSRGVESIGSGVVIGKDWILTNAHVVEGADQVGISWADSDIVFAERIKPHSEARFDIALIKAPGFSPSPTSLFRAPKPAEEIVVLAYPAIPRVRERPLLRFLGNVATDTRIKTYFGDEQAIISAVMSPGASGGPIYSADGWLVGIVVQTLEGKYEVGESGVVSSTFHAAIPGDLLLEEIPKMEPELKYLNKWASSLEDPSPTDGNS